MKSSGAVIVSWDFSHDRDKHVLLVGERKSGMTEVINAFQGEEAHEIYDRLMTVKKK